MDADLIFGIIAGVVSNTFWMFAILWETNQRRKEANEAVQRV